MSDSSAFLAQWSMSPGRLPRNSFAQPFMRRTMGADILRERYEDMAPTFGEIDISLSFNTTIRLRSWRCPAWLSASNAMPAVIAPSPIKAITTPSSPR